jgi:uncharacterized membrane protein YdjX (TVP38/TMEM64 family)
MNYIEYISYLIHIINTNYQFISPLIFIVVHIFLAVFLLPCSPMAFIAGAMWGGFFGSIISVIAAISSGAVTFLLSRSLVKNKIEKILELNYPKIVLLIDKARAHDWQLILLVQLNPLIPASSMGYAFGLSKILFGRYILFSGIFVLPLTILFVNTGSSVINLILTGWHWEFFIILIFAILILNYFIKNLYNKLNQIFGEKIES